MPEAGVRRRAETLGIPVFHGVIWADNSEGDRKTGRVLYSQWGRLPDLQHYRERMSGTMDCECMPGAAGG